MDTWLASFAEAEIEKTAVDQDVADVLTKDELRALVSAEELTKEAALGAAGKKALGVAGETIQDAALGAAFGAVAGAATAEKDDRGKGALRGAGIGAAAGGLSRLIRTGLNAMTRPDVTAAAAEAAEKQVFRGPIGKAIHTNMSPELKAWARGELEGKPSVKARLENAVTGEGLELAQKFYKVKELPAREKALVAAGAAVDLGMAGTALELIRRANKSGKDKKAAEAAGRSLARIHTEEIVKEATTRTETREPCLVKSGCDLRTEMTKTASAPIKKAAALDEDTKRRLIAKISTNPPSTQKEPAEQYREAKVEHIRPPMEKLNAGKARVARKIDPELLSGLVMGGAGGLSIGGITGLAVGGKMQKDLDDREFEGMKSSYEQRLRELRQDPEIKAVLTRRADAADKAMMKHLSGPDYQPGGKYYQEHD